MASGEENHVQKKHKKETYSQEPYEHEANLEPYEKSLSPFHDMDHLCSS
jgi:hypothetical protein